MNIQNINLAILLFTCLVLVPISEAQPVSNETNRFQKVTISIPEGTSNHVWNIVLDGWCFSEESFCSNVAKRLTNLELENPDLVARLHDELWSSNPTNPTGYDLESPFGDRILAATIQSFATKGPESTRGRIGTTMEKRKIMQIPKTVYGEVRSENEVAIGIQRNHAARMILLSFLLDSFATLDEGVQLAYVDVLSKLWANPIVFPENPRFGQGSLHCETDGIQSPAEPLLWILSIKKTSPTIQRRIFNILPTLTRSRLHIEDGTPLNTYP